MHSISRVLLIAASLVACTTAAPAADPPPPADVFAALDGNWSGVLEYADYRTDRRVQLVTRLTADASDDGRTLTMAYVYTEPNGENVTSQGVHRIDLPAGRYVMGDDTFDIGMVEGFTSAAGGRMVVTGTVIDNDRPEPARHTITLSGDTLRMLKETRSPWQFRNEYRLVRVTNP
ncbi:hypothetical protein [Longimicrobium sp.]|uniref:hypothetical protein n=1 Tax=Longimicrobium sp. TaxID=2029185 RepID=UPI003B3B4E6C